MVVKKRNIFSINLSETAVQSLIQLNYLNGNKRATMKNLSRFLSKLIVDYISINNPRDRRVVDERILALDLKNVTEERNKLEIRIQELALKLSAVRGSNEN